MDANPDFTSVSTTDLETSITRLTANLNAATFQHLMMIAEFDTRNGWGHEGTRSCAHWLNWRCGISFGAAREKVRVAHALQHLPLTREAFASGQLSYSKARAITRIGTAENEECLLSFARYGTASQLDRTVQLYRKQFDEAGALMVGYHQRMCPEDQSDDAEVDPGIEERQGAMHHRAHRQLNTRWDEYGCLEIRARLTAEQGALVLKALEAAVESLKENTSAEAWPANKHQHRRADALVLMASQSLESTATNANTADRYQVVVHVDSQVLAGEIDAKPTGEPDCYIEKQVGLPVESVRRLSCSCKIVPVLTDGAEPLNIGRSSRAIPPSIRRALTIRDGQCMFPGCDCNKFLDAHHIIHWSNGGETSMQNLIEVCHYHHVQLHEGGYTVHRLATGALQFFKPDGTVLSNSPQVLNSDDSLPTSVHAAWYSSGGFMDYATGVDCIAAKAEASIQSPAL